MLSLVSSQACFYSAACLATSPPCHVLASRSGVPVQLSPRRLLVAAEAGGQRPRGWRVAEWKRDTSGQEVRDARGRRQPNESLVAGTFLGTYACLQVLVASFDTAAGVRPARVGCSLS